MDAWVHGWMDGRMHLKTLSLRVSQHGLNPTSATHRAPVLLSLSSLIHAMRAMSCGGCWCEGQLQGYCPREAVVLWLKLLLLTVVRLWEDWVEGPEEKEAGEAPGSSHHLENWFHWCLCFQLRAHRWSPGKLQKGVLVLGSLTVS